MRLASKRRQQLSRVKALSALHDPLNTARVSDRGGGVVSQQNKIRSFSGFNSSDFGLETQCPRTVAGCDAEHLNLWDAHFGEDLEFSVIAHAGHDPRVVGVRPGGEQNA